MSDASGAARTAGHYQVLWPVLKAGPGYFALVLAVGFVLGVVREVWVAPRFGARAAELMEVPIMLAATALSARWTVQRLLGAATRWGARLGAGLVALGLLLLAEFSFVLGPRGRSLREYVASRDPVSGMVYVVMLGVFAVMPLVVRRLPPDVRVESQQDHALT